MKPNYDNWIPKYLLVLIVAAAITFISILALFLTDVIKTDNITLNNILTIVTAMIAVIATLAAYQFVYMHMSFSYDGNIRLSEKIVNFTASYVNVNKGQLILDVGCGSGALSIACAKRNPNASVLGVDRWGSEYANFSKQLCEKNAMAEGISNASFKNGNTVNLDFPNESFDAIVSNYVYHNIRGYDLQELLYDTLKLLKKGGSFVIHDLFSVSAYHDMDAFIEKLKAEGFESVELIQTDKNNNINDKLMRKNMLKGSALLVGIK